MGLMIRTKNSLFSSRDCSLEGSELGINVQFGQILDEGVVA